MTHPRVHRNAKIIAEKLGFTPWGGCAECPKIDQCRELVRADQDVLCCLSDEEAGISREPKDPPKHHWPKSNVYAVHGTVRF